MFSFFKKEKLKKSNNNLFNANFYQELEGNIVLCRLCSHFCRIEDGKVGACRIRLNQGGKLFSLNYGRLSSINIDPIEKKPLFHFFPATKTLSLGSFGCNFSCQNCQNFSISQPEQGEILNSKIYTASNVVDLAIKNNCPSISYTYNEPTLSAEFYLEIMKIAKEKGLKNILVSNGYMSKLFLQEVLPYLDATNIDLKSSQEDFYQKFCDAHLSPVLENLKIIRSSGTHLEITTLLIPGLSDDKKNIEDISLFILKNLGASIPWHLSAFFPGASWKLQHLTETSKEVVNSLYNLAKEMGLKYVYTGNINDDKRESTYCPNCESMNIKRKLYEVSRLDKDGKCFKCGTNLDLII